MTTSATDSGSPDQRTPAAHDGVERHVDSASERGAVRLGYRAEIDGLRAFAVLAVIAFHYLHRKYLVGGFLGVDLFFVLSGFLITRLLLEERASSSGIDLPGFYLRRAARLFPALLLLGFVAVADALTLRLLGGTGQTLFGVAGALGYFANWAAVFNNSSVSFGHTWSLSIEEQFYIVWPAVLIVLYRWGSLRAVRIGAAIVVTVAAAQMVVRSLLGVGVDVLYNATDAHGAVMLVAGCLLATMMPVGTALHEHPLGRFSRRATPFVLAALTLFLTSVPWVSSFYYRGGFVLIAGLFAVLIARAIQPGGLARVLSIAPIVWIGRISYGLYLWHYPVWFALRNRPYLNRSGTANSTTVAILALLVTFAAATASYYALEMPIRKAAVRHRHRRTELRASAANAEQATLHHDHRPWPAAAGPN